MNIWSKFNKDDRGRVKTDRGDDTGVTFAKGALIVVWLTWASVFWLFIWGMITHVFNPELGVVYTVALWVFGLSSRRVHLRTWAGLRWAWRACFVTT